MRHAPQDPKVKEAYENLIRQTTAQYQALVDAGYKFWFIDPQNDPYKSPWDALRDLRATQTMGVFPTAAGFGSAESDTGGQGNPMEADTGILWPYGSPDGELRPVLANDLFRAVHDAFGHGMEGAGFREHGEENAWQAHVRLFTGSAVGAITSETRGQNSWLNHGPYGEKNRTAKVEDTVFADQKTGLMPEWTWTEGRVGDMAGITASKRARTNTPEFKRWFGDSKVVDENGEPLVVYHGTDADFSEFKRADGSRSESQTGRLGFWFATDSALANRWAGERGGANVMPVFLAIQNPMDVPASRVARAIESGDKRAEATLVQSLRQEAERGGHDGLRIVGRGPGDGSAWAREWESDSYIAFRPEQIKSAIGNRGTFDPENPDIRFSNRAAKPELDADVMSIFKDLEGARGLALIRARERVDAHPMAETIRQIDKDFLDILERLDDAGLVKINCT